MPHDFTTPSTASSRRRIAAGGALSDWLAELDDDTIEQALRAVAWRPDDLRAWVARAAGASAASRAPHAMTMRSR